MRRTFLLAWPNRLGRATLGAVTLLALLAVTYFASASAHFDGFGGGETQDWYTPTGQTRYIVVGDRPQYHSYSFVSNNDVGGVTTYMCARLVRIDQDGRVFDNCNYSFVRYCYYAWRHTGSGDPMLNCHDRDGHSWWAGTSNPYGPGTTVRIHGTF